MKAKKFVLIYFKTVKEKRSNPKQSELNTTTKKITAAKLTQQIHWGPVFLCKNCDSL